MPARWFEVDGETYDIEACLTDGLLEDRYPRSYLAAASDDREWTGTPSTTQLINGTRYSFLQITEDYAVDPEDRAFAVLGSRGHAMLQGHAQRLVQVDAELELRLDEGVTGITDLVEPYKGEYQRIVDYKVIGAFKVNLLINGKDKRKEWNDYGLQINMYRIMAERQIPDLRPHPDRPGWLFGIVRDGNTRVAHGYGIHDRTFMVPAPLWPNDKVVDQFKVKRDALFKALDAGQFEKCTPHETWEGRRCKRFCPVAKACKELG